MSTPSAFHPPAAAAAAWWKIDPATLRPVSAGVHRVYAAVRAGDAVYLRLTNPLFRSFAETQAECDYLAHLSDRRVRVAMPQRSRRGRHVETVVDQTSEPAGEISSQIPGAAWPAVLFAAAPGVEVSPVAGSWSDEFLLEWGRALGRIHQASVGWRPVPGWERKQWDEDYWMRNAYLLLPPDDTRLLVQYEIVMAFFRELPRAPATYGMTHGNFTPENFRVDPRHGITAFSFSSCGFHWTLWDVAIALTAGRHLEEAARLHFAATLLRGYETVYPAGLALIDELDWFMRLRIFYVYLSNKWRFGERPTVEQQETLNNLRVMIYNPVSWRS